MQTERKQEIISFKADGAMAKALSQVPNRSEFIRSAVLSALRNACPLCGGTGHLTAHQRRHWEAFTSTHSVRKCTDCRAVHLVCDASPGELTP